MAGTFWCLTLFPPHLQITKLVSPISWGKEKKANRSHIQAVATWTPQKLRLLQPQCLGLSVLPQNKQQADTLTSAWPTVFFFLSKFRISMNLSKPVCNSQLHHSFSTFFATVKWRTSDWTLCIFVLGPSATETLGQGNTQEHGLSTWDW